MRVHLHACPCCGRAVECSDLDCDQLQSLDCDDCHADKQALEDFSEFPSFDAEEATHGNQR